MNLLAMTRDFIYGINPETIITLYPYRETVQNAAMEYSVFDDPITIQCQVQPHGETPASRTEGATETINKIDVWLPLDTPYYLLISEQRGLSYLQHNGEWFTIMVVEDVYGTGWYKMVCVQQNQSPIFTPSILQTKEAQDGIQPNRHAGILD